MDKELSSGSDSSGSDSSGSVSSGSDSSGRHSSGSDAPTGDDDSGHRDGEAESEGDDEGSPGAEFDKLRVWGFLNYALGWRGEITLEGLMERTADIPSNVVKQKAFECNVLHNYVGSSAPCPSEGGMRDEEWPASEIELDVVQYLLDLAPDAVNKIHDGKPFGSHLEGAHPLHLACFNADCPVSVIRLLLEKNPSVIKCSCEKFGLPLFAYLRRACKHESFGYEEEDGEYREESPALPSGELDCEIVKMLVEAYPGALNPVDGRCSALSILCMGYSASLELAKLLTNNMTNLEDDDEQTALMFFFLRNSLVVPFPADLFHCLVACNPTCLKIEGRGAASLENPDDDDFDFEETVQHETPLHIAVANPNMPAAIIGSIIKSEPAMVKVEEKYLGVLPIHNLCMNNELEEQSSIQMLKYLVEADPKSLKSGVGRMGGRPWFMGSNKGKLPINLADENKMSLSFCQVLLHEQAKLSSIPEASILQMALICKCSLEMIKGLVEENHELVTIKDGRGQVALHTAVQKVSLKTIRYLVARNENALVVSDALQEIPLHKACRRGKLKVVEYLMEKNVASVAARNEENLLPMFLLTDKCSKTERVVQSVRYTDIIFKMLLAHPEAMDMDPEL